MMVQGQNMTMQNGVSKILIIEKYDCFMALTIFVKALKIFLLTINTQKKIKARFVFILNTNLKH